MKLLPEDITWSSLIFMPMVGYVLIAVFIPCGCGMQSSVWVMGSSGAVILAQFLLSIYEKLRHEEKRAAILALLNGTAIFWWVPISILIWNWVT